MAHMVPGQPTVVYRAYVISRDRVYRPITDRTPQQQKKWRGRRNIWSVYSISTVGIRYTGPQVVIFTPHNVTLSLKMG